MITVPGLRNDLKTLKCDQVIVMISVRILIKCEPPTLHHHGGDKFLASCSNTLTFSFQGKEDHRTIQK